MKRAAVTRGKVALPRRRERDVQAAILAMLKARGIPAWKVGSGAFKVDGRYVRMGQKGMADIIAIKSIGLIQLGPASAPGRETVVGQLVAIEVKSKVGKPTLEQRAFLDTVRKAGGIGIVARSCDDVVEALGL